MAEARRRLHFHDQRRESAGARGGNCPRAMLRSLICVNYNSLLYGRSERRRCCRRHAGSWVNRADDVEDHIAVKLDVDVLVRGIMGILVLMPCWLALNFIRVLPSGEMILLALFVLIWGADTGAYFAGKKWGKHKIIPQVSPGKSWEGLAGALLTTVLLVFCLLTALKFPPADIWVLLLLSLVTVLFSVLGDLFESMLKRKVDLKDSGTILPGHGGILDRIDSLTAAAPIFALGLILLAK